MRILLMLIAVATSSPADARSVFLNGVDIGALSNQKIENCSIEIDAKGNVYITAKGYKVEVQNAQAPPAPPTQPVTKRYWMVTEKPSPGMDQYELEVFVNGQFVKRVLSKDEQVYLEVTKFMHLGQNQAYVVAKKIIEGERKSTAPNHYSRVIIGEGDVAGRTIMIDKQLLDYKRTAAETQNFAEQFTIEGR